MERSDDILATFCEDLEAYVEGALPDDRRREMEAFLETSEEARALLAEFREADALFDGATWDVPPPKNLPTAQAILDSSRKAPVRNWNFFAWLRPSWVAALAGLLVVGGTTWVFLRSADQPKLGATAQRSAQQQEDEQSQISPAVATPAESMSRAVPAPSSPVLKAPQPALKEVAPPKEDVPTKNLPVGSSPNAAAGGLMGRADSTVATTDAAAPAPAPPPPSGDDEAAKAVSKDKKSGAPTKTAAANEVVALQAAGGPAASAAKPATEEKRRENTFAGGKSEVQLPPRNITLEISVADLNSARSQVTLFAQQNGGSVNVPVSTKEADADLLEIGARVPADKAPAFLKQIRGLGTVERESNASAEPERAKRKDDASLRDQPTAPTTVRVKLRRKK